MDHNEKSQAVNGIEEAEVQEIIDHHRLGGLETIGPVYFRNQPVGCTATIIYQMYQESGVEVEPQMAGLLCSAIISDTLLFRSPTCTMVDQAAAEALARIAGIDMEEHAKEMFNAGSNLRGKSVEEICFQDFKQFTVNNTVFGVGQINSMSKDELAEIKEILEPHLEEVKEKNTKLSTKVFDLFYRLVDFADEAKINKFNFFIKQLRDFESVLGAKTVIERADEIITQIENSIIAENPSTTLEIGENDLVIATPQKIIDNKISSKYQFWLDVSHSDWVKTDTGPLYNAWVFQADWTKDEYTVEDDIFLAKQKTARILRKLLLLAQEHVWACSSLFDPSGVENLGGIEDYLAGEANEDDNNAKPVFKITPRDDQKPVLDYKKGSMAISAVPGAGKTTILLALIIKLIERGVIPTNIFVLTYMDSAARNFRERIKNMCPNTTLLPNISTIHGLALKIIKENSNFERLNLSADFDICDDTQRMRIIKGITGKFTKTEADEFDRAISVLKLQEGDISKPSSDKKIEKFKTFFKEYQAQLREANLIDYDDILILSLIHI